MPCRHENPLIDECAAVLDPFLADEVGEELAKDIISFISELPRQEGEDFVIPVTPLPSVVEDDGPL